MAVVTDRLGTAVDPMKRKIMRGCTVAFAIAGFVALFAPTGMAAGQGSGTCIYAERRTVTATVRPRESVRAHQTARRARNSVKMPGTGGGAGTDPASPCGHGMFDRR